MSLDVYLTSDQPVNRIGSGIFVRENGQTVEISRAEWDGRNPGHEPAVAANAEETTDVFSANITHNLGRMAREAGIYEALWRPEEIGITKAGQLVEPLKAGLVLLRSDQPRFEKLNPSNGWGSYADFVPWIERYLEACIQHPLAEVHVSR